MQGAGQLLARSSENVGQDAIIKSIGTPAWEWVRLRSMFEWLRPRTLPSGRTHFFPAAITAE